MRKVADGVTTVEEILRRRSREAPDAGVRIQAVERDGKVAIGTSAPPTATPSPAASGTRRGPAPRVETSESAARASRPPPLPALSAKLPASPRELALLLDAGCAWIRRSLPFAVRATSVLWHPPRTSSRGSPCRRPFSDALERGPEIGPPYAIGMIRASEGGGSARHHPSQPRRSGRRAPAPPRPSAPP